MGGTSGIVTMASSRAKGSSLARQDAIVAYVFLAPWIIGFAVFVAGPMIAAIYLSLNSYSITKPPVFIGIDNFTRMFTVDPLFWPSLGRTAIWAGSYVPLAIIGSLMTAVLLNQGMKGTTIYRTIFFLPHLTPIVASIFIWTWLLHPRFGFVNEMIWQVTYNLTGTGVEGPGWFGSTDWAIPSLILVALWGAIGGNGMLIFLAGLQGVSKELYEVAEIDGANIIQRFWNITLPMISPTLLFNLVLGLIGALQSFANAFIATEGGPAYATWFFALHIYANAFSYGEYGYASALALFFFLIVVGLTYANFRFSTRWVHYGGEVN
ncbi:MAG: sugar ABC transporter permease [Chloroflexota bacterium]|nr:MAG: sugar ABC transporter permease [Chloroflexota bacterium]